MLPGPRRRPPRARPPWRSRARAGRRPCASASSILGDTLSAHDEIDRRKKNIHALKKLRAAGYRSTNHLYNRCECIESRKATSPAIKRLLQQDYQDRMDIERERVGLNNLIVRTLLPEDIREWLQS